MVQSLFRLTAATTPEGLKQIRNLVEKSAGAAGLSKKDSADIILAVDEVCSNIIRHGYKNELNNRIEVSACLKKNHLEIEIIDSGISFDLTTARPRDPQALEPGGLGVYIIKAVMDDLDYATDSTGRNTTRLIKKINHG